MMDERRKEDCCGCQACINICPLHCISLKSDDEGFWYPEIDRQICVGCGMCERVCPFGNMAGGKEEDEIRLYGAWCKDEEIRFSSSSGGLFSVFAEHIIEQGGIVFGARVDRDGMVVHACADTKEKVKEFRKSKYVQSNAGYSYREAREYLEQGRAVLFSGTPCQIMALHRFLGKSYSNLYTIDVICVGVSSPGVWKSYLGQLEKENGSKVLNVIFRHKEIDGHVLKSGWRNLTIKFVFENGKVLYQYQDIDNFFGGFLEKLYLRPSCAQCKAKDFKSGSDIQLGDFWQIEQMYPEVLDVSADGERIPFGISEVLIYTEKGERLFQKIREKIHSFRADLSLVKTVQKDANWQLLKSGSLQHKNRAAFFKEYHENPQNVRAIIERNLSGKHEGVLAGVKIGMWGSYNLRDSIAVMTDTMGCELRFQFRNSTICSIVSEPDPAMRFLRLSSNPFRNQMMKNDVEKEFRINIRKYAESIDYFLMDLLEERYSNLICGKTVVTKSEGYFESAGIQGMPLAVSFEMWKAAMKEFMEAVLRYFPCSKILIVENYLCGRYGKNDMDKHDFENREYIDSVNFLLTERYRYMQEQWPEIKWIGRIPEALCYTEADHRYGCMPEHMNHTACFHLAQEIGRTIKGIQSMRAQSE